MTRAATVLLLALSIPSWWRETNSEAASRRGVKAFERNENTEAAAALQRAHQIAPSPRTAFNLGTAWIAAGERARGSSMLEEAIRHGELRPDALFNRGNSALAAGAFDHAIRDYSDALRANPAHAGAKRNLEIALARRDSVRQEQSAGSKGQQEQSPKEPSAQQGQRPKQGDLDLEALLRSVQQQEEEELRRMKGRAAPGRVGW